MKKGLGKRTVLYALLIFFLSVDYLSLPIGTDMLEGLKRSGYLDLLFPLLYIAILTGSVVAIKGKPLNLGLKEIIFVSVAVALSALYFTKLREPNLKAHFLEYALITVILFKALELDFKSRFIYPLTLAGVTLIGILEEVAQSFYPTRTFDIYDIKIDFFSALIMIVIIYLFKEPRLKKPARGSF